MQATPSVFQREDNMKTAIINEKEFEKNFNDTVIPFCEAHEKDIFIENENGKKIHCLVYENDNAVASVLLLHGFTESALKLRETAYYFFNEGYSVYAPDLNGHGFSYRDAAPAFGVHTDDFSSYAKDVETVITKLIGNDKPLYCWSHSLGGTAILLALTENTELPVSKLVLSSPMICGNMGMPVSFAEKVSSFIVKSGMGTMAVPGKCVFKPAKGDADATSKARAGHYMNCRVDKKELQTCGPDFSWVKASLEAKDKLTNAENVSRIKAEILLLKPAHDAQLLESYQDQFITLCKNSGVNITVEKIAGAEHEIFQSRNEVLEKYYDMIFSFLGEIK